LPIPGVPSEIHKNSYLWTDTSLAQRSVANSFSATFKIDGVQTFNELLLY